MNVSDRFSYTYDSTTQVGLYHNWLWTTDLAWNGGSTHARTEIRFYNDYVRGSGIHQFSSDVLIPKGTGDSNIFQIFGTAQQNSTVGSTAAIFLRVDNWGNLYVPYTHPGVTLINNIWDTWFHLNVIHDANLGTITVYINGVQKHTRADMGPTITYTTKCGMYTDVDRSTLPAQY